MEQEMSFADVDWPELPNEFDGLPVFAVGGWVRDVLRGAEATDVDLMVAEVSPEEMLDRGFREIDSPNNETFGVFHDSLGREVAIAREEISTGDGHTDFDVQPIDPSVEATKAVFRDLERRDFTINAMAVDLRHEVLYDPHGGLGALDQQVIRHVSEAFRDDPLRVLRGARFAARFGYSIAEETKTLMRHVAPRLEELPGERIRLELEKAVREADEPSRFFGHLQEVGALEHSFEELVELPTRDFQHSMDVLDEASERWPPARTSIAAAFHELDEEAIDAMNERLCFSNTQLNSIKEASKYSHSLFEIGSMKSGEVLNLWNWIDDLDTVVVVAESHDTDFSRGNVIRRFGHARGAMNEVTGELLIQEGYDPDEMGGAAFGRLLRHRRIEHMMERGDSQSES